MKRIEKQIIVGTFIATAASLISTHAFAQEESTATVNTTNLNIRQQPTTQSPIVGQLKQGTTVKILEIQKDWAKISYNGKEGYVALQFLKKSTVESKQQPSINNASINNGKREIGVVTATRLNVRNSPVLGSTLLGNVQKGENVTILGKANGWAKIEYKGKEGYVSLEFIKVGEKEGRPVSQQPATPQQSVIDNGNYEAGTITATSLRVRSAANTTSTILGNLKQGEKVTVLGKANGWAKISWNGKEGYVSLEFVKLEGKPAEKPPENIVTSTQETGTITATSLRVRSAANTTSTIL
ncbi:SH3 domain-containing protein, partial [Bacillus rhizoplanae]|uniref:SH3 domain-containing protein n=1 Tax=Bacillus rhizoplanae TaxID=2880966 RepID=UPI003D208658